MSLKNCKRCGKLFQFQQHSVCQSCLVKDQEDFSKIWNYMQEHPRVSVLELSRETGVRAEVINRFRREGRLAVQSTNGEPANLTCEACGIPLEQGRYCQQCLAKLSTAFQGRDLKERGKSRSLDYSYRYKPR